ncbi:hypothetical protein SAMN05446037_102333 [Anaerovirgula multivorans]|uniref:Uncharacterized protein n=2 Tax=Anaerovirgula multivorans TaxID=312168 RepID=A0A239HRN6_9FIRM|nr:hypothetical protein SAMN05446037_102333 [Anaerovirgula multivorans]
MNNYFHILERMVNTMKKNLASIVINTMFWLIQMAILGGVIILEDLAGKKMGVLRHVIRRENIYASTYFTPGLMRIYIGILVVLGIFSLLLSVYSIDKRKNKVIKRWSITTAVVNLGALIYIVYMNSQDLKAYHYFLIVTFAIVGIHYIRLLIGITTLKNPSSCSK